MTAPTLMLPAPFEGTAARWWSEGDESPPKRLSAVDDRLTANAALARVRRGEHLLYTGDFRNARQLLSAIGRRLERTRRAPSQSLAEAFRSERREKLREHEALGRILVAVDGAYRLQLRSAPEVREACDGAWGAPTGEWTVVALRTLLGMMGAAEWRRKGLDVPGLPGRIRPHYGVFTPTRNEYVKLLLEAPKPEGKRVIEVGTGTGVLSFVLLVRGAREVRATDVDPRAVACARENARELGFSDRFSVEERDLFPDGRADLVVFNPPWIPEPPRTRMDRAIFDPKGEVLARFLREVSAHLEPDGEVWLILSDLAERVGLRAPGELDALIAAAGLELAWSRSISPSHSKARDSSDPLHSARASEKTSLFSLRSRR